MSEFTNQVEFKINDECNLKTTTSSLGFLESTKGVEDFNVVGNTITVEYYQQLISGNRLKELIEKVGIDLKQEEEKRDNKKEKNPLKRYINKLAESNTKNLGNQRLDCCDLNKKKY